MAKPQVLQKLEHGKLLTKSNFPQFVDTWNYVVNRCQNLKGDGDLYNGGLINIDNTNPEYPVVRLNKYLLGDGYVEGPFAVNIQALSDDQDKPVTNAEFRNCVLRYDNEYYRYLDDDGDELTLSCEMRTPNEDLLFYVRSLPVDDTLSMEVSCNTVKNVWEFLSTEIDNDQWKYTLLYTVNNNEVVKDWRYEMNIVKELATPDADVPPEVYTSAEISGLSSIQTKTRWNEDIEEPELSDMVTVMQLYNFDLSDTISVQLSNQNNEQNLSDATDEEKLSGGFDFIIRKDNQIQYAKLSVNCTPPDSSISAALLSSIQIRTIPAEDEDEEDQDVLQLYNFDLSDAISVNLNDQSNPHSPEGEEILSSGYEFIIRKDNKVKYAKLSVDTIKVDTEVLSAQKSLEWKTTDDEDNPQTYMQLYGMDLSGIEHTADLGISGTTSLLCDDYQFVIRRNGAGGEIDYLTLSVCLSSLSNSVSTIVSSTISSELSDLSSIPPDASVQAAGLSSIQINELDNNDKVLELYNFHALQHVDPLSTDDIVIRRTDHIDYVPATSLSSTLSTSIVQIVEKELSGKGGIPPDADVPAAELSSIQTYEIDGGSKVLELFQFHDPNNVQTVYLSAQNRYDFLMRDQQTHQLTYANLSGVGGEVTLSGTDNSSHKGSEFKFQSADDSNIIVNVDANGVITIGAYYL